MISFTVTGMSCAACSARVETAVSRVDGVTQVSVNLLTGSMTVDGEADSALIIAAVEKAGYGAYVSDFSVSPQNKTRDAETEKKRTLLLSILILIPLFYLSMAPMWKLPLPAFFDAFYTRGITLAVLALIILILNRRFFINGTKAVLHGSPNMDTLVALGSGISFLYSLVVLILPGRAFGTQFYFESSAMIVTLISIGKLLEENAKGRTTDALKALEKLTPSTANLWQDGEETLIPLAKLSEGDLFAVHPGEMIPADGTVVRGESAVDESALTGESLPVDKKENDSVSQSTLNKNGYLVCRATRVGGDTAFSGILRLVSEAASSKAPIARLADKVAAVFVPVVLGIALVTFIIWLCLGKDLSFALARSISVLVISCPCSLGLATPVAIMVAEGKGAKNGILFKNATALEQLGKAKILAMDKTGTLTEGTPRVTGVIPAPGVSREKLLALAAAAETGSEHPLALAVTQYAPPASLRFDEFEAVSGGGIIARNKELTVKVGSASFIPESTVFAFEADKAREKGQTAVFVSANDRLIGMITIADLPKQDSREAIARLGELGLINWMISGDAQKTARAVAAFCGIENVASDVTPAQKEEVIVRLQQHGPVAMVGDGINDAPALTRADIGIAVGAGTDAAISSADIILLRNSLTDVAAAVVLSRKALLNIKENLFWAFFYNLLCIPMAAGAFGFSLNPMLCALAMSLSSFCVVMNALRLNFINLYPTQRKEENKTMTLHIEGMMCHHCEAHVKKALEAVSGVTEVVCDFKEGTAVLTLSAPVPADVLAKAVTDEGYTFISAE